MYVYKYIYIEHSILDGQKMIGIHLIWMIKLWFPVEERQKNRVEHGVESPKESAEGLPASR